MFEEERILIDLNKNQYKVFTRLLGFKIGEWKQLPTVNFIAITKVKFSKTVSSPKLSGNQSCTSNFSDYKYCVFICESTRNKCLAYKGGRESAFKLAQNMAVYLKTEVINYTEQK